MKNSRAFIGDIFGWYGTAAILLAYALLSFSVVKSDQLLYLILNLSGAIGFVIFGYLKKENAPLVLNLVWAAIAFVAMLKFFSGQE